MQRDWFYAKARKYPTACRGLDAENLPEGVYDNLVKTLNAHRQLPASATVALKKRALSWIHSFLRSVCESGGHSGRIIPLKRPGNWCWPV